MAHRKGFVNGQLSKSSIKRKKPCITLWSEGMEDINMSDEDSVVPLEAMNIVVLGDPKVGKSSLIRRYLGGEFVSSYLSTVCLEYDTKIMEVEGKIVKLHIWDTSGQENFFGMTKKQIQEADGFLYVYDITDRNSFMSLPARLKTIQDIAKAPNLPMVLMGNKVDLRHRQNIASCEAKEFGLPEGMKVVEVSALSGKNVLGGFYTLALEIYKHRRLGGPVTIGIGSSHIIEPAEYCFHDHHSGIALEDGPNYTHLFKILIVGSPRVGKTAIRYRFCRDFYTGDYFPTPGTDFDSRMMNVEGTRCKVQVWDIGGDEVYDHTRRSYYKGANGFIIAYDVCNQKTFEKAEMLLKELDMYGHADAPKILVGNKIDRIGKQTVSDDAVQDFADGWRVPEVRVSARTGENVSAVFAKLAGALKKECAPWKRVYDFS